jgi:hypothetical protein
MSVTQRGDPAAASAASAVGAEELLAVARACLDGSQLHSHADVLRALATAVKEAEGTAAASALEAGILSLPHLGSWVQLDPAASGRLCFHPHVRKCLKALVLDAVGGGRAPSSMQRWLLLHELLQQAPDSPGLQQAFLEPDVLAALLRACSSAVVDIDPDARWAGPTACSLALAGLGKGVVRAMEACSKERKELGRALATSLCSAFDWGAVATSAGVATTTDIAPVNACMDPLLGTATLLSTLRADRQVRGAPALRARSSVDADDCVHHADALCRQSQP